MTTDFPKAVGPWGVFIMLLGAVLSLSGAAFAVLAWTLPPKPMFAMIGFEVIAAGAGVIAVLVGLGRLREAPGLALICVGGAALAGTVFGYLSASGLRDLASLRPAGKLGSLPLWPWYHGRFLICGGLGAIAVLIILGRDARAWKLMLRGALLGLPVVAVGGWMALRGLGSLGVAREGFVEVARITGSLLGVIALGTLFSFSAHCVIRAFQVAADRPAGRGPITAPTGATPS